MFLSSNYYDLYGVSRLPTMEEYIEQGNFEPYSSKTPAVTNQLSRRVNSSETKELIRGDFEGYRREFVKGMINSRNNCADQNLNLFDSIFSIGRAGIDLNLKDRVLPHFDGNRVKALCVFHYDGYGDAFLLLRYLKEALDYADEVGVIVPSAISELVRENIPESIKVYTKKNARELLHKADAWAATETLASLSKNRYSDAKWIHYRQQHKSDGIFRVGLAWRGSSVNWFNNLRSLPVDSLNRLFQVSGIEWHSLQVGEYAHECPDTLINHSNEIKSWSDTVEIISTLDLVISVDTGVANLAGAMGFPLWVITENRPDFRWGNTGETTPWFESARVFRKGKDDKWKPVIKKVCGELTTLVNSKTKAQAP